MFARYKRRWTCVHLSVYSHFNSTTSSSFAPYSIPVIILLVCVRIFLWHFRITMKTFIYPLFEYNYKLFIYEAGERLYFIYNTIFALSIVQLAGVIPAATSAPAIFAIFEQHFYHQLSARAYNPKTGDSQVRIHILFLLVIKATPAVCL